MHKPYNSSRAVRLSKFLKLGKSAWGATLLLLFTGSLSAQSALDAVLSQIAGNNRMLRSETQRVAAAQKELQTGLFLYDPQISYDFLKGFPNSAGNQNDLTVTQPFDYPTAYPRRRKLADLKSGQFVFESELLRKDILLEAKRSCLHLIFLNKRKAELTRRMAAAQQFLDNYQKKYDARDATALDLNKARHQVINLQTDLKRIAAETAEHLTKLTELNGGTAIAFADTLYPPVTTLPAFESLEQTIESTDPTLQFLQNQQQVGAVQVALTKALALPKMEAGYHYQGILGQNFHGLHVGLSVPLWENKNRVAQQQLQTAYYAAQIETHRNELFYEVKRMYEKYRAAQSDQDEYRQNLASLNNLELLDNALQAGQITTLEYFVEQSIFYESRDRLLELERETALALAELLKYQL